MSDADPSFALLSAEEVARLLPNYSEISFLAQGGMAAVYRGKQTTLDRPVAIKILPQEFGSDESFRLRFEAEGKAMARLNHPNLVSIFDFGEVESLLYLVMEFVEGQTLHQRIHDARPEDVEAVELSLGIAEGLAHAHQHNILHRDIKPANILLDGNGIPKLGDFGLAEGDEKEEGDNLIFGTPGYTSPEVMTNPTAADARADIFAVGILLHEMLTGSIPPKPYQAPSRLVQSDPRIDSLIAKAIAPHPDQRFQSANELAQSLGKLRDQMKAAPRRRLATASPVVAGSKPRATLTTGYAPSAATTAAPKKLPSKGFDFTLLRNLIIIAVLILAIFGATTALKNKQESTNQTNTEQQKKLERQKRLEEAKQKNLEAERKLASQTKPAQTPKITAPSLLPKEISPREQLEELKHDLASGKRERFPEGSLQRGSSHFFLIDDTLTWYEAIEFAEQHGGHLAILPSKSDANWLISKLSADKTIWVGAGATSRSSWAWLNSDIDFKLRKPKTNAGIAGSLNIGGFKASNPSTKLPFFIQWNTNGNQSTPRDAGLAKLAESLGSPEPAWPAGTLFYEDKRYLILAREVSQAQASRLAKKAGGALAVPSDQKEASFLLEATTKSGLPSLWLGGELVGEDWHWLTNEPWDFANWQEGYPNQNSEDSGLQINNDGWINVDPTQETKGLIIEWSTSSQAIPSSDSNGSTTSEQLGYRKLRVRAHKFLLNKQLENQQRAKDNFTAQGIALRQWLRRTPSNQAKRHELIYTEYTENVTSSSNRLPNPEETSLASLSKESAKILTRHYKQQLDNDQALAQTAETFRVSYQQKLREMLVTFKAQGLKAKVRTINKELDSLGANGVEFLQYLNIDPEA